MVAVVESGLGILPPALEMSGPLKSVLHPIPAWHRLMDWIFDALQRLPWVVDLHWLIFSVSKKLVSASNTRRPNNPPQGL